MGLARLFPRTPPPGPFRRAFWRSPLRGPWLTAAIGSILLVLVVVVAVTGFLSHAAYNPSLGMNAIIPPDRDLPLTFDWPTSPSWLYALTQGLHVNVGLMMIPVVLAKLWSVIPRLFAWPPVSTPAQAIERLVLTVLVASTVFELVTGVLNIQYWYPFGFNFVVFHYYGAVLFVAALGVHLAIKLPVAAAAYRARGVLAPLRDDLLRTRPEPSDPHGGLAPVRPDPPTMSRRGLLAFMGAGSLTLLLAHVGASVGGPLRPLAFLAPRRGVPGEGPNAFPINKSAAGARITPAMVGASYRLELRGGPAEPALSRAELLALPQSTAALPIACVEGWSTTQEWTGVRLSELARLAGVEGPAELFVESLQPAGALREATLSPDQVADERSMLALRVNGADLALDHGFPARLIVPALPGVHNTKWVGRMTFRSRA